MSLPMQLHEDEPGEQVFYVVAIGGDPDRFYRHLEDAKQWADYMRRTSGKKIRIFKVVATAESIPLPPIILHPQT